MGNGKRLFVGLIASAVLALAATLAMSPSPENWVAAADAERSIAISVDGMTPVEPRYEIPVGSEQGFSVLSIVDGEPAGLLRTGSVEWSLAGDGGAHLEAIPGEFVATVRANASGEAGLYAAAANGLADMISLVFTEMKPVAPSTSQTLSEAMIVQPRPGAVLHVPPAGTVPFLVKAETNAPGDTRAVHFAWPDRLTPIGTSRDTSGPPYTTLIPDITGIGSADIEAVSVDTFASATASASWTISTAADSNGNGFPDDPFGLGLRAGDAWLASPAGSNGAYVVLAGLPSAPEDSQEARGSGTFSVIIPGTVGLYEVRAPEDLIRPYETGILVLAEASDLDALLSAGLVAAQVPVLPDTADALLSSYLLVDVLVSEDTTTWAPLHPERLAANPLQLIGHDVPGLAAGANARLYGVDVTVVDGGAPYGPKVWLPPDAAWAPAANGVALSEAAFTGAVSKASILGLFSTDGLFKITNINNVALGGAQDYAVGGGIIEITCANLPGISANRLQVTIDNQAATVTLAAGGVITAVVPRAADLPVPATSAAVDIRVEITGADEFDAIPGGFTYLGPAAASVAPTAGPASGGTNVVVEGAGFDPHGMSVSLGGAAVRVGPVTPVALAGVTGSGAPGRTHLELRTANNFTGALADAYTYTTASTLSDVPVAAFDADQPAFEASPAGLGDARWAAAYANGKTQSGYKTDSATLAGDGAAAPFSTLFLGAHRKATGMTITNIVPAAGPVAGGAAVLIRGAGFPPVFGEPAGTGNVIRIGRIATGGEASVSVPVHLFRAADAASAPSVINFFLSFDTGVLAHTGYAANPALTEEYGKNVQLNVGDGTIGVILYGGMDEISLDGQVNPFELFTLSFDVLGYEGESSVFQVRDLTMATADAENIADLGTDAGIVTVGDSIVYPAPPRVLFGANEAALTARGASTLEVIAPAGAAPAAVDVAIDASYPGNPSNTAVSLAAHGGGFTYIPEGGLQIAGVAVVGGDNLLPAEGGSVVIAGQGFSTVVSLMLVFSDGTTIALVEGTDFTVDNDGRISLTITPERLAELLKANGAGGQLPPGPVTLILETAAGSATIENAFVVAASTAEVVVRGIHPDGAWVIGGFVAEILGDNFGAPEVMAAAFEYRLAEPGTSDGVQTHRLPLEILSGPNYPNSSERLYVRIPPLPGVDDSWPAAMLMNRLVVTRMDAFTEDSLDTVEGVAPFTYYRWHEEDDGVVTTAFYYTNSEGAHEREIVLNSGPLNAALTVPPLPSAVFGAASSGSGDAVYVVARAALDETAFGGVDFADMPGSAIEHAWAFDIHLYTDDAEAKELAPPAGELLYRQIAPEFHVPANTDGTAVLPARLTIPVNATALTAGTIRNGTVALYGQPSVLEDLAAPVVAPASATPSESKCQSHILESFGSLPELFPYAGVNDTQRLEAVRARVYRFGALTLRQGIDAAPEPALTSAVAASGGPARGPVQGGDEVVVFGSGLGWIESVEFGQAGKAFTPAVIVSDTAANEFAVRVLSPAGSGAGTVDIRVTTAAGKQALLQNAFSYTSSWGGGALQGVWTLLLGLVAALVGLFSGGAPGSGGPCFIATAAYDTPFEAGLDTLRGIRDIYLLENPVGTAFVDAYYRFSPPLAAAVAKYPMLAVCVRLMLAPLIALCHLALAFPNVTAAGVLALAAGLVRRMRRVLRGA